MILNDDAPSNPIAAPKNDPTNSSMPHREDSIMIQIPSESSMVHHGINQYSTEFNSLNHENQLNNGQSLKPVLIIPGFQNNPMNVTETQNQFKFNSTINNQVNMNQVNPNEAQVFEDILDLEEAHRNSISSIHTTQGIIINPFGVGNEQSYDLNHIQIHPIQGSEPSLIGVTPTCRSNSQSQNNQIQPNTFENDQSPDIYTDPTTQNTYATLTNHQDDPNNVIEEQLNNDSWIEKTIIITAEDRTQNSPCEGSSSYTVQNDTVHLFPPTVLSTSSISPTKRKRGRPAIASHQIDLSELDTLSPEDKKYAIFRFKNNEASRKSRKIRQDKEEEQAAEREKLEHTNKKLQKMYKRKCKLQKEFNAHLKQLLQ